MITDQEGITKGCENEEDEPDYQIRQDFPQYDLSGVVK